RVEHTARGALEVDSVVLVEALVLGCDEGLLDFLGYVREGDDFPVDLAVAGHDRAVAVLVDVALHRGVGVPLGNVDRHVERDEAADAEQAQAQEGAEDLLPGEHPAYEALLRGLGTPAGRRAAVTDDDRPLVVCRLGRAVPGRSAAAAPLPRSSLVRSSHESA